MISCKTVEPRIYVSVSKRSSPHTYEDAYSGTPRGGNWQISRKGTKRMKRLICSQADKKEHRPPDQRWSAPDGGALSWMELAELGSTQSTQSVFLPPMTGSHPLGPSGTERCESSTRCCIWGFVVDYLSGLSRGPLV